MKYLTSHSLITLSACMSLAACAATADEDGASASAPGVSAAVDGNGARASAGEVDVTTAQLALDELSSNVDVTVDGFNGDGVVPPPPDAQPTADPRASATRGINVTCAAGGDADLDGYVNVAPAPVAVDVKLGIAFNNCVTRTGTTINGDLDFSQTVVTGPGMPLQVETIYQGDVALAGRVNASCSVDLNVLVDEAGRAVKVQGKFCNRDASELRLQVQPRWQLR